MYTLKFIDDRYWVSDPTNWWCASFTPDGIVLDVDVHNEQMAEAEVVELIVCDEYSKLMGTLAALFQTGA